MDFFDFEMVYDDWTTTENISIRKSHVAIDIARCIQIKYSKKTMENNVLEEKVEHIYDKVLGVNQKLAMMMYAQSKLEKSIKDFEITQNMDCTAFYGLGQTAILFYFESMIIFARNALDMVATIYADLLFKTRMDSFNKLCKRILDTSDESLCTFREYLKQETEYNLSVFRLLCGSEKGRSLRDTIIHQANANLMYDEYKEGSERERLFLCVEGKKLIDIKAFMQYFTVEVENMLSILSEDVKNYLETNK